MSVPGRVLGMTYTVNPEDPVSAPRAYTARSLAIVGFLVAGMVLIVLGLWHRFGWDVGVIAIGACLIAAVVVGGPRTGP